MAIASIPFTTLYLVEHAAGGAIVNAAGAYVGGTYVPAGVVHAFSAASSSLAAFGTSVSAVATSPLAIAAAVTIVAAGGYCYLFGVPAPVAKALVTAGLVEPAKGGLAVTMAKLAGVLVVLGGAGLVAFNVSRSVRRARRARRARLSATEAEATSRSLFGDAFWTEYGAAAWAGVGDAAEQAWNSTSTVARAVRDAAERTMQLSSDVGSGSLARLHQVLGRVRGIIARA